jgi:transcriptional regulator with XRE-family HTH domain
MPKRSEAERELPAFDLKAARESKGITQERAAELLFASQSSIARWEGDGRLPRIYREYWALYWQHNKPERRQPKLKVVKKDPA